MRIGRWKGVRLGGHERADAPIQLYDLETDPGEAQDVAAQHPDIVARVRDIMQARTESPVAGWNFAAW